MFRFLHANVAADRLNSNSSRLFFKQRTTTVKFLHFSDVSNTSLTKDAANRSGQTAVCLLRLLPRARREPSTLRKCTHSSRITANVSNVRAACHSAHRPHRRISGELATTTCARLRHARTFVRCTNCLIIVVFAATFYLVFVAVNDNRQRG